MPFKILLGLVLFFQFHANATLRVNPQYIEDDDATTAYYFATSNLSDGFIDSDSGYSTYDLTLSASSYPSSMLILEVNSDNTSFAGSSGNDVYLSIYARASDDSYHPVPIAAASNITAGTPAACGGSGTLCKALNGGYYFSALYTIGSTLTIGIYPKDLCTGMNVVSVGKYPSGCAAIGTVTTPTDGATTKPEGDVTLFTLDFVIGVADSTIAEVPNRGDSENDEKSISISFQNKAADVSCSTSPSVYFPGDEEIIVFPSLLTATLSSTASAPIDQVIVVGNEDSFAASGSTTGNAVFGRVDASQAEGAVGGFQNVEVESKDYNVAFTIRDQAGIITNYATSTASDCAYGALKTSGIQGFLAESKCFIATGAYGVKDNAALHLLRDFRDEVLLKSSLGVKFVSWYYSWSPEAAQILIEHPWARLPVLRALVPIQIVSWLFLHPLILMTLMVSALGLIVLTVRRVLI